MRTIKMFILLLSGFFLVTSCYTQLALVERQVYQSDDYYYPPSDTLYSDGSPVIVQNFYNTAPYDFTFGMHIGFYDDWWLWSDWYYPRWPRWGMIYYPLQPIITPYWLYPGIVIYDPFYWDYYYDYWWTTGPVYTTPYGPRPFSKGGTILRDGGSKRVRISKQPGNDHFVGDSKFLPTRTTGSVISSKDARRSVRKSSGSTIRQTTPSRERISTPTKRTIVRKDKNTRNDRRSTTIIRRTRSNERKYYPITSIRSTKPKNTVKQPKATERRLIKTKARSTKRSYETHRSTYTTTSRSHSVSRPSYSTPSRTTSRSSGTYRSSSSTTRSSSRSATRSSSSRSTRTRK